jgi:hypothetical protein
MCDRINPTTERLNNTFFFNAENAPFERANAFMGVGNAVDTAVRASLGSCTL